VRIYVAGLLSRNTKGEIAFAIEYLENIAVQVNYAMDVLHLGHVPFCPALDFMFFVVNSAQHRPRITEKMIKAYSMEWLRASDAILLTPNWQMSPGTRAELAEAQRLGLKVFDDISQVPEATE
jgi:hypothetical protein